MAKIPKFNLIIDGELVRDIDQLQDNFCVEDMLDHFKKQRLQKWLKCRGFDEYLAKVEAIEAASDLEIIKQLMEIFDLQFVQSDVENMLNQIAKQKKTQRASRLNKTMDNEELQKLVKAIKGIVVGMKADINLSISLNLSRLLVENSITKELCQEVLSLYDKQDALEFSKNPDIQSRNDQLYELLNQICAEFDLSLEEIEGKAEKYLVLVKRLWNQQANHTVLIK